MNILYNSETIEICIENNHFFKYAIVDCESRVAYQDNMMITRMNHHIAMQLSRILSEVEITNFIHAPVVLASDSIGV